MDQQLSAPGPRYPATLQLLRTAETVWNNSLQFFARWDLSPSQFNVMNLLVALPEGMSQVEVSRELIMHRSNVTGLIDRLEARGWVARQETPGDRRAYRVVLTPKGARLMAEILPYYYYAAEALWGTVPAKRVQELARQLTAVCANADRLSAVSAASRPPRDGRPAASTANP